MTPILPRLIPGYRVIHRTWNPLEQRWMFAGEIGVYPSLRWAERKAERLTAEHNTSHQFLVREVER